MHAISVSAEGASSLLVVETAYIPVGMSLVEISDRLVCSGCEFRNEMAPKGTQLTGPMGV